MPASITTNDELTPWVESDDGWLVLDDRQDGVVTNGRQLFGKHSAQAASPISNGYKALAVFDDNSDGVITATDGIWPLLGIWRDYNRDGVSDVGEIRGLTETGIRAIELTYRWSHRLDRHGNG